jgi:hypothetical protein
MAGTSGTSHTLSRRIPQFTTTLNLSRQREKGLRNGKAEAPPVLSFGEVALFRIFGKATRGLLKIRKPTKWPSGGGAFSDQGERKLSGLRLERFSTERRFDEAPQVR